jgi:hypothetical protein
VEFDGATFVPAPGVTYNAFRDLFYGHAAPAAAPPVTAMPSLRELKEAYSDKAPLDRRETGRLNARLALVERDCQDWYAEATKVSVAGTEIGDLIRSQIPTSADSAAHATAGSARAVKEQVRRMKEERAGAAACEPSSDPYPLNVEKELRGGGVST